jgi:myosin heavy subunit
MSPAEKRPNSDDRATADQSIETVYTTVEAQHDRTDWLTVVSNLRQINRQLVEEIARLEQALASAKQTLHTHKQENQTYEITILQQQDELKVAQERVGALFQQLETSHQIGQRQQTLIETLSQQLEITQTIVPQLEAEHEQLTQKYQQQAQKLIKTEQVAVELHRRLKILQSKEAAVTTLNPTPASPTTADCVQKEPTSASDRTLSTEINDPSISVGDAMRQAILLQQQIEANTNHPTPEISTLETAIADANIFTVEIEPAPPLSSRQVPQTENPNWTTSAPTPPAKTILSPPKLSSPAGWREAIASNNANYYNVDRDPIAGIKPLVPETVDKESTAIDNLTTKSSPNWPAPTVNRGAVAKAGKIDLPKFPKKIEG